ncbi:MAG: hypothetical protein JRC92_06500 [Deltaproteobacteria bacterium]|nr:hypothetical protein [Deltaproteobacteria bacterium]
MNLKRRRIEIKKWLLEKGVVQAQIARETGMSESSVSHTISGLRRIGRVVEWLREHGCPEELLERETPEKKAA